MKKLSKRIINSKRLKVVQDIFKDFCKNEGDAGKFTFEAMNAYDGFEKECLDAKNHLFCANERPARDSVR